MGLEDLTGFLCNWVPAPLNGVHENKRSEPFTEPRRSMSELSDLRKRYWKDDAGY